jgi:replicative DNA helicase
MEGFLVQVGEKSMGQKKQKEIQIELEKTRVLAQIKELETVMSEWMDRLKETQAQVSKESTGVAAHVGYLDRWYREEERETELFLHDVQNAMSVINSFFEQEGMKRAA